MQSGLVVVGYASTASPAALRELLTAAGRGSRVFGLLPLSEPEVAVLLVALGGSRGADASVAVTRLRAGRGTRTDGPISRRAWPPRLRSWRGWSASCRRPRPR